MHTANLGRRILTSEAQNKLRGLGSGIELRFKALGFGKKN